jgi:hypothetical protein
MTLLEHLSVQHFVHMMRLRSFRSVERLLIEPGSVPELFTQLDVGRGVQFTTDLA